MTHDLNKQLSRTLAATAAACAALIAGEAAAQTIGNSAELNGGWGRWQGTENAGIDVRTRDSLGNRVIVDGIIQDGSDNGEYVETDASGAGSVFSGAGGRSGRRGGSQNVTAIGNNLQVITQGNWNTVIVNSTQINNGNVTANSQPQDGEPDPND